MTMAASGTTGPHLIDRMPACRGRLSADAPLAPVTWFRVGGPAEVMFRPADADDLAEFLAQLPAEVPVTVIGVASNLLVRDGGIPGVTIRLGRGFTGIAAEGDTVTVGAAALDLNVATVARDAGIAGLEFLSGIPGTIGGALRMNGGAYGRETADVLVSAQAVGRDGRRLAFDHAGMGFTYRHAAAPADCIFTGATLRGEPGNPLEIARRMAEISSKRADSQPIRSRTGGSTFKNPTINNPGGHKAWELIDEAGCRGLSIGDAQVSEKHCNFLINQGTASAADLEALGEEVRRRVFETSGVTLEWEIKRVGIPAGDAQ
ncbi:UDP-N-acetylmuramate dehydrogenase [Azospirillum agricola]|uniref:UDP-N-acetylmuramate dehydrogenase n=1 Tax=Azospirillum agricola TaxID=1720247 RepID=UPI000A0EFED1|nr:UDP-N-acetylmuramate dehydrogenase [Azospirillum lipoferum]